ADHRHVGTGGRERRWLSTAADASALQPAALLQACKAGVVGRLYGPASPFSPPEAGGGGGCCGAPPGAAEDQASQKRANGPAAPPGGVPPGLTPSAPSGFMNRLSACRAALLGPLRMNRSPRRPTSAISAAVSALRCSASPARS